MKFVVRYQCFEGPFNPDHGPPKLLRNVRARHETRPHQWRLPSFILRAEAATAFLLQYTALHPTEHSLILRLRNVTHTLRMEAEYCFETLVPLYTAKRAVIFSEHGGSGVLRKVGAFLPNYTASQGGNLSTGTAMDFRTLSNCQLLSV
jgi:hypothetical protein